MRVAVQIDQLFFQVPGGIGTCVRNLVPAMAAREPALALTLFHARFGSPASPERWLRDHRVEELRQPIRSLYPRWALFGRPPLPPSLRGAEIVHARRTTRPFLPSATGSAWS